MADLKGNKDALLEALMEWWAVHEGSPSNPSDARLMQALWGYHGDQTESCAECDGDCGEPCAPCTAEAGIASLEMWIERYNERHGIKVVPLSDLSATAQQENEPSVIEPRRDESTAVHNNKWGYRGVEWERSRKMFRARIEPGNGRRGRWLGRFDSAIEAAKAYDDAAREIYGEHAYLNFPRPGEKPCVASRHSEGLCPKGHSLKEHGYPNPRGVSCRLCNNAAQQRYYKKSKLA